MKRGYGDVPTISQHAVRAAAPDLVVTIAENTMYLNTRMHTNSPKNMPAAQQKEMVEHAVHASNPSSR